jgi:hypothetical protein
VITLERQSPPRVHSGWFAVSRGRWFMNFGVTVAQVLSGIRQVVRHTIDLPNSAFLTL